MCRDADRDSEHNRGNATGVLSYFNDTYYNRTHTPTHRIQRAITTIVIVVIVIIAVVLVYNQYIRHVVEKGLRERCA